MITAINSKIDYETAIAEIERLIDLAPRSGTPEGDRLNLLSLLVQDYEQNQAEFRTPDPIEAIKFRMEQMDLTPRDLVPLIGSRSKVSEVLSGKRPLTLSMVRALHKGLGVPAKALLQEQLLPGFEEDTIEWERFPIREMVARGWIRERVHNPRRQAGEVMRRFLAPLGSDWAPIALYKQTHYVRSARRMDAYALAAWKARVCIRALEDHVSVQFKPEAITDEFMHELAHLSVLGDGPKHVGEYLASVGVCFVIEPHLPETYIDGAAILVKGDRPIVALTLRHDRVDNFWFVLMHELAHVSRHLSGGSINAFYDDLDVDDSTNAQEREADEIAGEALIPEKEWSRSPARNLRTPEAVSHLANKLRIHPALVAGRIRHHYKSFRVLNRLVGHKQVRSLFPDFSEDSGR
ncbi:MAG TPA: ImmA/IrrE family metallo-endopeptidase [Candidatus Dormibacteraeota bacterium]|jgi:HTH-type transcriptional regulator/antitoxin HigA|nr:ImmA/IrrE family metallo-endopeptidase [Candidatus Dormibacteraeota bacterium]